MLFSKCLRAKIYCNMNVQFDPQGCQTLLLKEDELFFLSLGSWTTGKLILGYSTPKTRGHVDFSAGRDKMGQGVNTRGQGAAPF